MADIWELRVVWKGLPPTTNVPHNAYMELVGPMKFGLPDAPVDVTLIADNRRIAHFPMEEGESHDG